MNPLMLLSFAKSNPKSSLALVWILSLIATAYLTWQYKPVPPAETKTVMVAGETQTRYIERFTSKPDGTTVKETVQEVIDKNTYFESTKTEEPKYIASVSAIFNKELKWEYNFSAGKLIFPQTYLSGGVSIDGVGSPQSVNATLTRTFRNIPFLE